MPKRSRLQNCQVERYRFERIFNPLKILSNLTCAYFSDGGWNHKLLNSHTVDGKESQTTTWDEGNPVVTNGISTTVPFPQLVHQPARFLVAINSEHLPEFQARFNNFFGYFLPLGEILVGCSTMVRVETPRPSWMVALRRHRILLRWYCTCEIDLILFPRKIFFLWYLKHTYFYT